MAARAVVARSPDAEDQSRPRSRRTRVLAIALFALAMAQLATAIAAALASSISWANAVGTFTVTNGAMGLGFAVCGVLLAWHRPRNPIGWLFLAAGVADGTSVSAVQLMILLATHGWDKTTIGVLGSLFIVSWPVAVGLCLPMALLLFPDGRPVSPRWRWLIWVAAVEGLLFVLGFAGPGQMTLGDLVATPYLTLPFYHRLAGLWTVGSFAWSVIVGLALASLVIRYRRGGDVERRQLLWLLLACLAVFGYAGLWWGLAGTGPILGLLVIPLIPAAITVAILRYQLLDIRLVFSRTLAYAIVTGLLVGVYAGLVLLITQALPFSGTVAVAASTLACAALFMPLRRRIQRMVDRQFNRARYDADQAIAAYAARLKDAVDLDAVSADLTAVVQTALEPAHVSVWISRPPR
jgi:two-component system, NarL family, sensor kinase